MQIPLLSLASLLDTQQLASHAQRILRLALCSLGPLLGPRGLCRQVLHLHQLLSNLLPTLWVCRLPVSARRAHIEGGPTVEEVLSLQQAFSTVVCVLVEVFIVLRVAEGVQLPRDVRGRHEIAEVPPAILAHLCQTGASLATLAHLCMQVV